jgi:hypothetical protein
MSTPNTLQIRVWLAETEPFDVETRFIDFRNYERTAFKHKWPPFSDAPMTWMGFLAWSAAKRTGVYDGTWESFEQNVVHLENIGETPVDPTDPGNGAD